MIDNFYVVTGEVDRAINILIEVAQWCEENKIGRWKVSDLTKERLTAGVNNEDFCVGRFENEDACSMILQWYDPLFWPEAKENEAGYIHKLCVRRKYSGLKLSGRMVEFAIAECKRKGIGYLRLDTGWSNKVLCNLYESLGFSKFGKKTIGTNEYALYEMKID